MTDEATTAYERGLREGVTQHRIEDCEARLAGHDEVLRKVADAQQTTALAIQALEKGRESDAKARIATAEAIEKADQQRRVTAQTELERSEQLSVPWNRILLTLTAIAAIVGTVYMMTR